MKLIFKYGLLAGAAIFIYIMLELALGLHGKYLHIGQYTGYFRYFFLAAGIYVGINDLRREPIGTVITFWSAVGKGLGISVVTAICVCISEWLYIDFINPQFFQDFTEFTINKLKAANAPAEQISELLKQAQVWKPRQMQLLVYFAETMILGFIFSLVVSAIVVVRNRQWTSR
jgi:hypothetical protein